MIFANGNWLFPSPRGSDLILYFLKETLGTVDLDMQIKRERQGDAFFCPLVNASRGAAILITLCLVYNKMQIQSDNEGLFQMCFWKLKITRLT